MGDNTDKFKNDKRDVTKMGLVQENKATVTKLSGMDSTDRKQKWEKIKITLKKESRDRTRRKFKKTVSGQTRRKPRTSRPIQNSPGIQILRQTRHRNRKTNRATLGTTVLSNLGRH